MKPILVVLNALLVSACTTHRLPPLPPERDPTSEAAPVTPWRAPPDVLHGELSDSAGGQDMKDMPGMQHDTPGMQHDDMKDMPGMKHDDMKGMPGMRRAEKSPTAPAEKKEAP